LGLALLAGLLGAGAARAQSVEELQQLSVSELANLDVSSVSKAAQPLSEAPASIYVITHDDIIRSGATTLPEMLRLAPNLFVAQTSASDYVITARGFAGSSAAQSFSDKLLVLIDGRTVYTPLFSGVYWDMQGLLPEDIDRIEVISGPGATLWGANAVNGVINVITKKSYETQGGFAEAGGGNLERYVAGRYGGRISESLTWRAYVQEVYGTDTLTSTGATAFDHFSRPQGGFRLDWVPTASDAVTLQGDAYYGFEATTTSIGGGNLTGRWTHNWAGGANLQVQAFFDRVVRGTDLTGGSGFWQNMYDLDAQHSFPLGDRNQIVWGGGLRFTQYRITGTPSLQFSPNARTLDLSDGFVQDTITLAKPLKLILGLKVEDDPYSGVSVLPQARLTWTPRSSLMLWAAASRAIRSPTPFDTDVREYAGPVLFLQGNPNFESEKLTAYELGLRAQPAKQLSFSVSGFYNQYNDLRHIEITPATFIPLYWGNGIQGYTYGLEGWSQLQAARWWRLMAGLDLLSEHLKFEPGATPLLPISQDVNDPKVQARLHSSMNLGPKVTLDADLRYVGALPDPHVPAYTELNGRIAWALTPKLEVALAGFNLLHDHHQEFPAPAGLVARSVFAELRARF
jgi:iron complex outermembrane receptor protein